MIGCSKTLPGAIVAWLLFAAAPPASAAQRLPDWAQSALSETCLECHPSASAVVVLDAWELRLREGDRRGTRRRVVHIFDDAGLDAARLTFPSSSFRRYRRVRVWVQYPGGLTKRFSEEDGSWVGAGELNMLDDTEVLVVDPPGLVPGCSVAVEVSLTRSADWPQDVFPLQAAYPVAKTTVVVDARAGWRVEARHFGAIDPGPSESTDQARWEFRDLPALPGGWRGYAPVPPSAMLALRYLPPGGSSPFESWQSTANWFRAKFRLPDDAGAIPPSMLREFDAPDADPVDIAGQIARRLRYFAIELGWGGYIPRTPAVTLRREFGDCKDKTQVMLALLRSRGIEGYPVLAVAAADSYIPDEIPSPELFNHVITAIPWEGRERRPGMVILDDPELGPVRLFDATLSASSGQDIGLGLEGGTGLILHPDSTTVVRFPRSGEGDNLSAERNRIRIDPDGEVEVEIVRSFGGALRQFLESEAGDPIAAADLRRQAYPQLAARDPGLQELRVGDVERRSDGTWAYTMRYRSPSLLARFGELRLLEFGELMPLDVLPRLDDEVADADEVVFMPLRAGFRDSYELIYDGWKPVGAIAPIEIHNSVGSLFIAVEETDAGMTLRRSLSLVADRISGAQTAEVTELREGLRRAGGLALAFERSATAD